MLPFFYLLWSIRPFFSNVSSSFVSCCSCRGRGQLWRGISQSKDSGWGTVGALHLDPNSGKAVMLPPPKRRSLTATDPTPPFTFTAKPASPVCLYVCPTATSELWQSLQNKEADTGSNSARQRQIPKKETAQMWTQWKDLISIPHRWNRTEHWSPEHT